MQLLAEMELQVAVEVAVEAEGAEAKDGLTALEPPARSSDRHSVLDQVVTGSLDDPGRDRQAGRERLVCPKVGRGRPHAPGAGTLAARPRSDTGLEGSLPSLQPGLGARGAESQEECH